VILDTNCLSAIADGDAGAAEMLEHALDVVLPIVVIGEYTYGIRQSRHREAYEAWLRKMIESCRILTANLRTADEYAAIRLELKSAGRPIPENDIWIAAMARQHDLPVLSRDGHFDHVPGICRLEW